MKNKSQEMELTEWVRLYTRELYVWAVQRVSDHQLAEDLVQDTFLAASENLGSFRGGSQPKTWLVGILKNKIADHYRKMLRSDIGRPLAGEDVSDYFVKNGHWTRGARPLAWPEEPAQLTDIPAFNHIFDACIEHLPAAMRACIRLKFLDEKKGEEICQELGISDTNYWQLIRRAKLQLRECLEKNWFRANK
ncbi:MAG: sigma-70 family RNA polymerase sigma factor [Saprospiraceae bacterium]|nr:sigma-70 family RNA polymerase sigma factor [Lewinella sp.]